MKGTEASVASELRESPTKEPVHETRKILGPGGNRARVPGPAKPAAMAKPKKPNSPAEKPAIKPAASRVPGAVVRKNGSVDSSSSADSSSSSSASSSSLSAGSSKTTSSLRRKRESAMRSPKGSAPVASGPTKRCDWITANSDPLYMSFHDEEWGVPVRDDDDKLYELLVLSIALAEHTWVSILSKRDRFRALFDNFNPASVAKFSEEKLLLLCADGNALLSEPKLRAVVDNAKQILKVQEEFGSFSKYCWRFVNNQPMRNGYRYARQVPSKTPKAELVSKDLIRRGFRCVGPTVIYSFMQVSGMVNDHLMSCFRYEGCSANPKKHIKPRVAEETETVTHAMEKISISHGS